MQFVLVPEWCASGASPLTLDMLHWVIFHESITFTIMLEDATVAAVFKHQAVAPPNLS